MNEYHKDGWIIGQNSIWKAYTQKGIMLFEIDLEYFKISIKTLVNELKLS